MGLSTNTKPEALALEPGRFTSCYRPLRSFARELGLSSGAYRFEDMRLSWSVGVGLGNGTQFWGGSGRIGKMMQLENDLSLLLGGYCSFVSPYQQGTIALDATSGS